MAADMGTLQRLPSIVGQGAPFFISTAVPMPSSCGASQIQKSATVESACILEAMPSSLEICHISCLQGTWRRSLLACVCKGPLPLQSQVSVYDMPEKCRYDVTQQGDTRPGWMRDFYCNTSFAMQISIILQAGMAVLLMTMLGGCQPSEGYLKAI